jgi:predicted ATPase/class 3 adenylate cyclase
MSGAANWGRSPIRVASDLRGAQTCPADSERSVHAEGTACGEILTPLDLALWWVGARRCLGAMALPAGTVTLLFSDIEGSTRLLECLGERYADVLDEHRRIVRDAVVRNGGEEVRTEGDAFFVAFDRAGDALRAAVAAQLGLSAFAWPAGAAVRVRMGLHTGEPRLVGGDYVGMDVHCAARICSAAHGAQVVVSEATQRLLAGQSVEGVVLRDLGDHRLKDLRSPLRLYQVEAPGLVATFPPLRAIERPGTDGLGRWAPPTALYGREADLEALAGLTRGLRCRLITLVGPGGVGKTRLAIAVATDLASDFADGARFVALASIVEPRELASAIARTLGAPIREGESPRSAVLTFLADRHLLLVLDNFEQLVEGATLVGELVSTCPGITVLVTSREPAGLAAEQLFPVRPLAVPTGSAPASVLDLERYPSVAVFLDRARARDPYLSIDRSNASHVSEICRRLDGLPLALELAAARVNVLALGELRERLDHALGVLVVGTRDAPERQRTLRATIDWSVRLLADAERQAFARMAVFPGGAPVVVAEAITSASLETLASLVDKQLLVRRGDRLAMLETVREYALERLAEDPDADAVHLRLAEWCEQLMRESAPDLRGAQRGRSLARLDAELPNVLSVLSWALRERHSDVLLRLVGSFGDYWWYSDRWQEGLAWVNAALDSAARAPAHERAMALLYRARLTNAHVSYQEHHDDLETSLSLFRACNDTAGIAACLGHLAFDEAWCGRLDEAEALAIDAVENAQRAGDERALAYALSISALTHSDYEDLTQRAAAAVNHLQAIGDLIGLLRVCGNIGYRATVARRYDEARNWLDQGLAFARLLDDPAGIFFVRTNQGLASLFLDDLDGARHAFCDALTACRSGRVEDVVDETLLGLGAVEASRGDHTRAARLAGAAHGLETAARSVDEDAIWYRLHDEILTPARGRYGLEKWDRVMREAASLTVSEAIDLALAQERFAPLAPAAAAAGA